jgi:hypothetical protein
MNVPLQLKQITQHTTQVAFSTSFLLGGCVVAGRDDETHEAIEPDAGDDAVIEAVQFEGAEAASHAYHEPDAPVVMPLEMEDAPTSLPPAAALDPPREPKEKRSKQTQGRRRAGHETEEDGTVIYSYEVTPAKKAVNAESERSNQTRAPAEKAKRDPVAESFLHTYGASGSYQTRQSGTRY